MRVSPSADAGEVCVEAVELEKLVGVLELELAKVEVELFDSKVVVVVAFVVTALVTGLNSRGLGRS